MERKTLLRLTQDILELMESDLVSTINETVESQMVHRELRNTYMHLMSRPGWDHLKRLRPLDSMVVPPTLTPGPSATGYEAAVITQPLTAGHTGVAKVHIASISPDKPVPKGSAGLTLNLNGASSYQAYFAFTNKDVTGDPPFIISAMISQSGVPGKVNVTLEPPSTYHTALTPTGPGLQLGVYWDLPNKLFGATLNGVDLGAITTTADFSINQLTKIVVGLYGNNINFSITVDPYCTSYDYGIPDGYTPYGYALPTPYLKIPDNVSSIEWLSYDTTTPGARTTMRRLEYLPPEQFLNVVQAYDTLADNVEVCSTLYEDIELPYYNDKQPTYWTSFDNKYIVCNSVDKTIDTYGLVADKTQVNAIVTPVWETDDNFIPDMPPQLFPLLMYETAELCMEVHDKDPSAIIARRSLHHRALVKNLDLRHDGKSRKGFGRRR